MKNLAALGALKLSAVLSSRVNDAFFSKYSRIITPDIAEEELSSYSEDPDDLEFDSPVVCERYEKLYELCDKNPIVLSAIELYLLARTEECAKDMIRRGMGCRDGLTIETAARITYRDREVIEMLPELRKAYEKAEILLQAECGYDFVKAPFGDDSRLASWLSGDDTPDELLCGVVTDEKTSLPQAVLTDEMSTSLAGRLSAFSKSVIVHVSGEASCGRKLFAATVARKMGRKLLTVPFSALCERGKFSIPMWRRLLREMLLTERLVCISDLTGNPDELPVLLKTIEKDVAAYKKPVFITTKPDIKLTPHLTSSICSVIIPAPTITQSIDLWQSIAESHLGADAKDFPSEHLAVKMILTAGQIEKTIKLLAFEKPRGPWEEADIFRLCYRVLDDGRYENIKFVEKAYNWDDLQLEPSLKASLCDICAHVEHQVLVLDSWGLRRRYPYGRCVSVLMSGPPGTGKTMTAQVLASKLGLEIYKVDLSQIVDKYIGETEKRLGEVFDRAEKSNMVLFFDEADALLGKRTEVKDSKDKYANTEVAYLLQRMEEYRGIVLMATNQAGNMDPAFMRRFRYHLVFSLPDEALRRKLWEDALSGIPSSGVRYDYLASKFELSGAQIKNIALNAAFRAAESGALNMEHLIRAISDEFRKEGKVMLAGDFGEYGVLIGK